MSLTKAFYSVRQYVFNGIDNINNYIENYRAPSMVEAVTDGDNALQTAPDIWFPASGFLVQSAVNTYRPIHCKGVLTWNNTTNSVLTLQVLGFKNFNNSIVNTKYSSSACDVLQTFTVTGTSQDSTTIFQGEVDVSFQPLKEYDYIVIALKNRGINATALQPTSPNTSLELAIVQDLAVDIAEGGVKKVGFQGMPGTELIINGNNIMVGKSGQYELYHPQLQIVSLGVIPKLNQSFIVTVKY